MRTRHDDTKQSVQALIASSDRSTPPLDNDWSADENRKYSSESKTTTDDFVCCRLRVLVKNLHTRVEMCTHTHVARYTGLPNLLHGYRPAHRKAGSLAEHKTKEENKHVARCTPGACCAPPPISTTRRNTCRFPWPSDFFTCKNTHSEL